MHQFIHLNNQVLSHFTEQERQRIGFIPVRVVTMTVQIVQMLISGVDTTVLYFKCREFLHANGKREGPCKILKADQ